MRLDFKKSLAAVQRIDCNDARVETGTPLSVNDAGGLGQWRWERDHSVDNFEGKVGRIC